MSVERTVAPYARLARLYDHLMDYIDYEEWVDVVDELLEPYAPGPRWLDISCGTASMGIRFAQRGRLVTAVDISPDMLTVAQEKADRAGVTIEFSPGDMRTWQSGGEYDVVINLHDGLNYLLKPNDLQGFIENAHSLLKAGGVLVCDVATPLLCQRHFKGYHEIFGDQDGSYERITRYDAAAQLAETRFQIQRDEQIQEVETHIQRAYSLEEVRAIFQHSPFGQVNYLDDDTLDEAHNDTERILILAQRQNDPL